MVLDRELKTYKEHLPDLLQHEGKYVLIHEGDVIDFYTSFEDAVRGGYRQFSLQPFLVKQILHEGEVAFFSRDVLQQPERTQ